MQILIGIQFNLFQQTEFNSNKQKKETKKL